LLQVANKSPFVPLVSVLADETGVETLYVVLKGTFDLAPNPKAADSSCPRRPETSIGAIQPHPA
jgi:hypothetical protein